MEEKKKMIVVTESLLPLSVTFSSENEAKEKMESLGKLLQDGKSTIITISDSSGTLVKIVAAKIQYFYLE